MRRRREPLTALLSAILLVGCADAPRDDAAPSTSSRSAAGAPDPIEIPRAPAPNGLTGVWLPPDSGGIADLFGRMPSTVAGQTRTPQADVVSRTHRALTYGDGEGGGPRLRIQAIDVSVGGFFPNGWTALDVVASMTAAGGDGLVTSSRDGDLVWAREKVVERHPSGATSTLFTILWGDASSAWLFSADADTLENLDALVGAFVVATRG